MHGVSLNKFSFLGRLQPLQYSTSCGGRGGAFAFKTEAWEPGRFFDSSTAASQAHSMLLSFAHKSGQEKMVLRSWCNVVVRMVAFLQTWPSQLRLSCKLFCLTNYL